MATSFTHAFLAGSACLLVGRRLPRRFWVLAGGLAVLPDIDYLWDGRVADRLGMFAHRGLMHSFLAAAAVAGVALALYWRYWRHSGFFSESSEVTSPQGAPGSILDPSAKQASRHPRLAPGAAVLWLVLFAATASHGLLDLFIVGTRGVALLAPFTDYRFASPWRLIDTGQMNKVYAGEAIRHILQAELLWIWLPMTGLLLGKSVFRGRGKSTN